MVIGTKGLTIGPSGNWGSMARVVLQADGESTVVHVLSRRRRGDETAAKESFVSIEKAERQLGYAPRYSNEDALLRNYQWYLDNLERIQAGAAGGVTHRVPWKQGALALAKLFV